MKTVAIILNYNDADTTIEQLERIVNYKNLDKIVIVDNASTDDSRIRLKYYVKKNKEKFILIQSTKNNGYGEGNNIGLVYSYRKLKARFALIANPDTEFSDELVAKLVNKLEKYPNLAIIGAKMVNPNYPINHPVNLAGTKESSLKAPLAFPVRDWIHDMAESEPISRRIFRKFLHYPKEYFEGKTMARVDAVPGSLFLCDISKLLFVGGFDKDIFLYEEEVTIANKLKKAGYKEALYLNDYYIHRHSTTISKSYSSVLKRQRLREKSTLKYYEKYLGIGKIKLFISKIVFKIIEIEVIINLIVRYFRSGR